MRITTLETVHNHQKNNQKNVWRNHRKRCVLRSDNKFQKSNHA